MEDILALVQQGLTLSSQIKTIGAIGLLSGVLLMLMNFTKTKLGQSLLTKLSAQHKWLRPAVAVVLGFLSAALTAMGMHKPWLEVLMAGLGGAGAGLVAIGGHEVLTTLSSTGRADRQAASAVQVALSGNPEAVKAQVEAYKVELDRAAALPDKKARMAAIAAWAVKNPPGQA